MTYCCYYVIVVIAPIVMKKGAQIKFSPLKKKNHKMIEKRRPSQLTKSLKTPSTQKKLQ